MTREKLAKVDYRLYRDLWLADLLDKAFHQSQDIQQDTHNPFSFR